jgi:hypothetical protein
MGEEKETLEVASVTELYDWLVRNELRKTGIWLVTYKANSLRGRQISYAQIVDEYHLGRPSGKGAFRAST